VDLIRAFSIFSLDGIGFAAARYESRARHKWDCSITPRFQNRVIGRQPSA
jgi:hypothetical protein